MINIKNILTIVYIKTYTEGTNRKKQKVWLVSNDVWKTESNK